MERRRNLGPLIFVTVAVVTLVVALMALRETEETEKQVETVVQRVTRVERVLACEDVRAPDCRRLALRVLRACLHDERCREALTERRRRRIERAVEDAIEQIEDAEAQRRGGKGGDSSGPPGLQGGGLPGPPKGGSRDKLILPDTGRRPPEIIPPGRLDQALEGILRNTCEVIGAQCPELDLPTLPPVPPLPPVLPPP